MRRESNLDIFGSLDAPETFQTRLASETFSTRRKRFGRLKHFLQVNILKQ